MMHMFVATFWMIALSQYMPVRCRLALHDFLISVKNIGIFFSNQENRWDDRPRLERILVIPSRLEISDVANAPDGLNLWPRWGGPWGTDELSDMEQLVH